MKLFVAARAAAAAAALLLFQGCGARHPRGASPSMTMRLRPDPQQRVLAQGLVTFDEHSLFVRGERVMIFSGEFHPWRLPVPSLWIDVFQKVKALGFNCVSFYVNWALLEGQPGNFTAEGVFDFGPFFQAAKDAGVYLIARPGPYINAEVSFGGFPGWLQRVKGVLRTTNPDFLAATDNYVANIARIIADAQITNGGPVILYQPENEYSVGIPVLFPDASYMQYVEDQARKAGIVVPMISNDAAPLGHNAPGSGKGAVDIYGHDGYPMMFDCSNPSSWPALALPTYYHTLHQLQSPSTPYSLVEFQGGSFDPWGGAGFERCAALLNHEFERVFYKNNYAAGVTIFNVYMIYGGVNWGGLGYPGGYFSYDYGAAISEDGRTVGREKYAELKLEAQFLKVSPGYLTATPGSATVGVYSSNAAITVTRLEGNGTGDFYVIRHSDYASQELTEYTLTLPISPGELTVPLLNLSIPWIAQTITTGPLTLNGRDSKMIVTNYDVRGTTLLYSTAEIFTHQRFNNGSTVLLVYSGGSNERNEMAVLTSASPRYYDDDAKQFVNVTSSNNTAILSFVTHPGKTWIVQFGDFSVYMMDRNEAYKYWVIDVPGLSSSVIVKGPYLVRSATLRGNTIDIKADFNASSLVEILGAPPTAEISINGKKPDADLTAWGAQSMTVALEEPHLELPSLSALDWKYVDSLPELRADYDDSLWPNANVTATNNSNSLQTPVSLYGSDYGFHSGVLIFRGRFTAPYDSTSLYLKTQGGTAYAWSAWINGTLVYSWDGDKSTASQGTSLTSLGLVKGADYVLTVMVDNMGYDEEYVVGYDTGKAPRGIMDFRLYSGLFQRSQAIAWKITGNLGGEHYRDHVRGPLDEGGLFVERHGYHQPGSPSDSLVSRSPLDGINAAGVGFFTTQLNLSLPADKWDVPLAFVFETDETDTTASSTTYGYRALLWVNGWNFGRYVSHLGPQTRFPVPEGILDYNGTNSVGVAIWATHESGARLPGFALHAGTPVLTGREPVLQVDSPAWSKREGAY